MTKLLIIVYLTVHTLFLGAMETENNSDCYVSREEVQNNIDARLDKIVKGMSSKSLQRCCDQVRDAFMPLNSMLEEDKYPFISYEQDFKPIDEKITVMEKAVFKMKFSVPKPLLISKEEYEDKKNQMIKTQTWIAKSLKKPKESKAKITKLETMLIQNAEPKMVTMKESELLPEQTCNEDGKNGAHADDHLSQPTIIESVQKLPEQSEHDESLQPINTVSIKKPFSKVVWFGGGGAGTIIGCIIIFYVLARFNKRFIKEYDKEQRKKSRLKKSSDVQYAQQDRPSLTVCKA